MNCQRCGNYNAEGSQQCVSCGQMMSSYYQTPNNGANYQYGQQYPPQQTGQNSPANQYHGRYDSQPTNAQSTGPGEPPAKDSKSNKVAIIITLVVISFVVIAVIAGAITIAVFLSSDDPNDSDEKDIIGDDDNDDGNDDIDYDAMFQAAFGGSPSLDQETITEDTTWDADPTYNGSIFIPYDVTVTINPGVSVLLGHRADMFILGDLVAVGTENDPIVFGLFEKRDRYEQPLIYHKGLSENSISKLEYCQFEDCEIYYNNCNGLSIRNCELTDSSINCLNYSTADIKNNVLYNSDIWCQDGSIVSIEDNYIESISETTNIWRGITFSMNCNGTAINNEIVNCDKAIHCTESYPTIKDNTIYDCEVGISLWDCNPVINYNTIYNCSEHLIDAAGIDYVDAKYNYWGTTYKTTITGMMFGSGIDFSPCLDKDGNAIEPELLDEEKPILEWTEDKTLTETYVVEEDKTLIIKAGVTVTIKEDKNYRIYVKGSLQIEGVEGNMVTITQGGDTRSWEGIVLADTSHDNKVVYCIIENCATKAISFYDTGSPQVTNCIIRNSTEKGIYCTYTSNPIIKYNEIYGIDGTTGAGIYCIGSSPVIQYNQIHNNTRGIDSTAGAVGGSSHPTIDHNSIVDNDKAIYNGDDATSLKAEDNFWNSNDDYSISKMFNGDVDYDPWLESSPV